MSQKDKVIFMYNNALNYKLINNFELALKNIDMAEMLVDKNDTFMNIRILNNKASCLYEINEKQEALKVFNQISSLIDKNSLEDYLINLTNIIHVCIDLDFKDELMMNLDIVIDRLVNLNKNSLCVSNIYFQIGEIYKELDKLDLSEDYYLKALNFSEEQKNYVLANKILNNLIDMCIVKNNVEKMNIIKEKVFCIAVKKDKIDNVLMYKLIGFYDKIGSGICTEISNFALKFK